jgi:hypothetical protein
MLFVSVIYFLSFLSYPNIIRTLFPDTEQNNSFVQDDQGVTLPSPNLPCGSMCAHCAHAIF